MCLVTKQSESKIASKDITCYKVLLLTSDNFYISPHKFFTFFENQVNPKKVFKAKKSRWLENVPGDDLVPDYMDADTYELCSGFFHMYQDYDSAVKAIRGEKESYVIFECVIPKGSRYYEGITSMYLLPSIASDRLKFVKQI